MQIKRPLMWFVGPWPPTFFGTSHTQKVPPCRHIRSLTHTVCLSYITFPPHSFLVRNQKWSVMVLIHKWRPMRPLRSPVAFLAIKEPPEGSCWVKLKAHQVLLIKTGEWGASVPPQKQNGKKLHQNSQLGKNAWQPNSSIVSVTVMTGLSLLCLFHTSDVCGPLIFKGWEAISN